MPPDRRTGKIQEPPPVKPAVVAHALGGRGRQISEFEASLVYRVSSRTGISLQMVVSHHVVGN